MIFMIMKPIHNLLAVLCGLCFTATSMAADELIIFPNAGQTGEQQEADKFACYGWAKNQSGFDPMAPPKKEAKKGGTGRGLLRGAAIGGIDGGSRHERLVMQVLPELAIVKLNSWPVALLPPKQTLVH
jgi:hypothetical protein